MPIILSEEDLLLADKDETFKSTFIIGRLTDRVGIIGKTFLALYQH